MTLCSFNSYILPAFMYFKLKRNQGEKVKMMIGLAYCIFSICSSLVGLGTESYLRLKSN